MIRTLYKTWFRQQAYSHYYFRICIYLTITVIPQKWKLSLTKFDCKASAYEIPKENLELLVSNTNSE